MNVAMLLEMAADAMGDRVAIGNRSDGLTYEGLRRAARAVADRVDDSGARHLALRFAGGDQLAQVGEAAERLLPELKG